MEESLNLLVQLWPILLGFVTLVILIPSMTSGMEQIWVESYQQLQTYMGVE